MTEISENLQMGRFITFEGGEGAGKTTLIRHLAAHFESRGTPVVTTREPGSGEFGKRIREILLDGFSVTPKSELFLFLADRANHIETFVKPALAKGKLVLCDRYSDSTFVYQSAVRGIDEKFVRMANDVATGYLVPEITFLLDLDAKIGLARLDRANRLDKEPLEFHEQVRAGFLALARREPNRFVVIDGSLPPDEVLAQVKAKLESPSDVGLDPNCSR